MSVTIREDGRIGASGSRDGTVKFWDLAMGTAVSQLVFEAEIWGISTTPDMGLMVVGEKSGKMTILTLDPAGTV